jgi:hypothetical protein|eukprot:COSAG02_NODE_2247_length_9379_cov_7.031358_6_plen_73_part_00
MQTGLANAQIQFKYIDGSTETLELVPPYNYWSLVRRHLSLARLFDAAIPWYINDLTNLFLCRHQSQESITTM